MSVIKFPPEIALVFGMMLFLAAIILVIILILRRQHFMRKRYRKVIFWFLIVLEIGNMCFIIVSIIIPSLQGRPV